jgi:hypothetical protein
VDNNSREGDYSLRMSESESVVAWINEARVAKGLEPLLAPMDADEVAGVTFSVAEFSYAAAGEEDDLDDHKVAVKEMVDRLLLSEEVEGENGLEIAMVPTVTHVEAVMKKEDQDVLVVVSVYSKLLALEAPGPVINGDLVLQGTCVSSSHSPALCVVSTATDDAEEYEEVARVHPWQMMYTPPNGEEDPGSFAIPVSVDKAFVGSVKIKVYVADATVVSYDIPDEGDETTTTAKEVTEDLLVECVALTVRTSTDEEAGAAVVASVDEADVAAAMSAAAATARVVTAVAVVALKEEAEALALDGFEPCEVITDGSDAAASALAGCILYATYGPAGEGGVEDTAWVTATDAAPEGFVVVGANLLAGATPAAPAAATVATKGETEAAADAEPELEPEAVPATEGLYLAVRTGPAGAYSQVSLVRFAAEGRDVLTERLAAMGPSSQLREVGAAEDASAVAGIALVVKPAAAAVPAPADTAATDEAREDVPETGADDDNMSRMTMEEGELEGTGLMDAADANLELGIELETSESFVQEDIGQAREVEELRELLQRLQGDLHEARGRNAEAQKKTSALMAKQAQQSAQSMNSRGVLPSSAPGANEGQESAAAIENNAEKEKHFNDTLKLIRQARVRLQKQQAEFDQLVVDLQARLDDKEFRAMEIADTFKEFKREILAKAEHSRTNKPLSKRVITEFEEAEALKDGELERVRLRNISLRTGLRKVERALKAKEQLAEGLHMIDFEQLKIENQTLNEKIEERNEELGKLKRKKTATVQVLTHIREKLRFVQKEIEGVRGVMANVDGDINAQRALLATLKKDRDFYKTENTELRRLQGFATSDLLLDDFDERKTALESAKANIRELKERHSMLLTQISSNEKMTQSNMRGKPGVTLPKI